MSDLILEDELGGDGGDQAIYWFDPKLHTLDSKYKHLYCALTMEETGALYRFLARQYISPENDTIIYHLTRRLRDLVSSER